MIAGKLAIGFVTKGVVTVMRGGQGRCRFTGILLFVVLGSSFAYGAEVTGRVVGEGGEGIADAVVFAQTAPSGALPSATVPSATLDQVHKEFVPDVLPVAVGTKVHFPNHDQIHHHVYSFSRIKSFELPLYKGEATTPVVFDKPGLVKVGCNIHDWMSAIIFVTPTPYFTKTDKEGRFTLSKLPEGSYAIACWHKYSQSKVEDTVQQIVVDGTPRSMQCPLTLGAARTRPPVRGERGSQ